MPVLVMKATEGFADRMTYLSNCIHYCINFNTYLCVDWSDLVWGGEQFDFHDVFELIGVKTMTKEQVVKLMVSRKVKVNPPCWTAEDVWKPITQETWGDEYAGDFFASDLTSQTKIEGDVLVTNGKGVRSWYSETLLNHMRIRPEVSERIRVLLKDFNSESLVVHLRGTDRYDEEFCSNVIKTVVQFPEDLPVYVVTDSVKLYEEFISAVPRGKLVNPRGEVMKLPKNLSRGTHQVSVAVLNKLNCSKFQLVIDLLVDFIAIWSAKISLGYKESFFYKLARDYAKQRPELLEKFVGFTPCKPPSHPHDHASSPSYQHQPCVPKLHPENEEEQKECLAQ